MYYVVTGAAGFIGSNLVKALNARGEDRILAVDHMARADKFRNLVDCSIADFLDRDEFIERLTDDDFEDDIVAILHQGACSDTLETDGRYMMQNNYRYSVALLDHCQDNDIPLLYASSASVYGASTVFREEREFESPLNIYGYSKFLFDQYVRSALRERTAQVAGFRYFNVYGPREAHKRGRGSSVAFNAFTKYQAEGHVQLFGASAGYGAGEHRRDFIHVDDVAAVNMYFLEHRDKSGIFNLGTGSGATFNELAAATVNACRRAVGKPAMSVAELVASGEIRYIPLPAPLEGKYQSFTQADTSRLRAAGYTAPMLAVADGVPRYVEWLISGAAAAA